MSDSRSSVLTYGPAQRAGRLLPKEARFVAELEGDPQAGALTGFLFVHAAVVRYFLLGKLTRRPRSGRSG